MKWIDIPPVWLAGALVLAWLQKTYAPMDLGFGPVVGDLLGGLLIGGGVVLMAMAVLELRLSHVPLLSLRGSFQPVFSLKGAGYCIWSTDFLPNTVYRGKGAVSFAIPGE